MKKLKIVIFAVMTVLASLSLNTKLAAPANAECVAFNITPGSNPPDATTKTHFLGLRAWYDGLEFEIFQKIDENGQETGEYECYIKELDPNDSNYESKMRVRVWTILFNIASMLTGILGYLAIGFVIYGGFQYMLSRGNPAGTASAIKTITNALIGLAICCSASIISGAISDIVVQAKGTGSDVGFVQHLFNSAFMWAGIIATIMVVYNGFQYIISAGDTSKVVKAKNGLTASIIGLIIVLAAAAIVNVVVGAMN